MKAQALIFGVWSRQCFLEVCIDNRSKLLLYTYLVYQLSSPFGEKRWVVTKLLLNSLLPFFEMGERYSKNDRSFQGKALLLRYPQIYAPDSADCFS